MNCVVRIFFCAIALISIDVITVQASALYPDEPTGFTQLVRHQFNDKTNGGACPDYYPGATASILSDSSWTISPSSFLRNLKPAYSSQGGTVIDCPFAAQRNIFWGFAWRSSNPFGGYTNAANKMGFMMTNRPAAGGALWGLHYYGSSNGARVISVFLQASTGVNNCHLSNWVGDCNGSSFVILPNINGTPVAEGVTHRVEVTMRRSSTESSRDGVIRVVIDGIVRTHYPNANFPAWDFISVQSNHTWDGQCANRPGGNPLTPTVPPNDCRTFDDWHDFDDWYVSGGTGGGGTGDTTPPGQVTSVTVTQLN